ncbi:glycoside hydrolase family 25 [Lactobacillus sp. PV037]|uniref:GH25 family lysozyme n=1 Tax=Lactobacillus sp. PV037 TaxID=2594496 RepID=UPI00223F3DF0|nr:GH25 family lysozyme [Lactobacillus sp. PV037]QNQ83743.1 glycoside hydrolase family 25 [Lactobacillus sp. PV037]
MLKMVDVYSDSPRSFATQSGTDITMVKATQGTGYVNPYCDVDYQAAKKAGKLLGIYHYCSGGNPEAEAEYFYKNTKNYVGEAVPAVDWEEGQNASWGNTSYVKRFVTRYHELSGVYPLIYVQESGIWQVANCSNLCGLWVAKYPSMNWKSWTIPNMAVNTSPWGTYTIWQFTGDNMDRNIVNLDKKGWLAIAKGDSKKSTTAAKESISWKSEKGTFTAKQNLFLRTAPEDKAKHIATIHSGDEITYDAYADIAGYRWLRQPRSNGTYGYLPCKNNRSMKYFGNFSYK